MLRKIIAIDEEKCDGCGICAQACLEGAIGIVRGKARLLRDDYCDGMGDCLPSCPAGAITFENREALVYDAAAVQAARRKLRNFPIQLKLVNPINSALRGEIVLAADCTAFAAPDSYKADSLGKAVLIGCPKLDATDYSEKLAEIFSGNEVTAVTLLRMSVPCCGGLERMLADAIARSGKEIGVSVKVTEV
ncbi:MAG: 4Fe-4S binding protein [Oscillospiraceae bacterium]|jgi:ferredoxin|nr:4Fe-4S binding protein [Oscillospiraceae bacterium]